MPPTGQSSKCSFDTGSGCGSLWDKTYLYKCCVSSYCNQIQKNKYSCTDSGMISDLVPESRNDSGTLFWFHAALCNDVSTQTDLAFPYDTASSCKCCSYANEIVGNQEAQQLFWPKSGQEGGMRYLQDSEDSWRREKAEGWQFQQSIATELPFTKRPCHIDHTWTKT